MYIRFWAVDLIQKNISSWNKKHENPRKIDGILYVFRRALFIEQIL